MQVSRTLGKYQLVPLYFSQASVAASQTNVQLYTQEVDATVLDTTGYVMPFAGEIIAISAHLSAAATAGSLTVGATIAGTEAADPTLSITTETAISDRTRRGVVPFSADAVIGAEITSSAAWDATTADLQVIVWVILTLTGI